MTYGMNIRFYKYITIDNIFIIHYSNIVKRIVQTNITRNLLVKTGYW